MSVVNIEGTLRIKNTGTGYQVTFTNYASQEGGPLKTCNFASESEVESFLKGRRVDAHRIQQALNELRSKDSTLMQNMVFSEEELKKLGLV